MARRYGKEKPETQEDFKKIVAIKEMGELSNEGTAERLGISVSTVERAVQWAKETGFLQVDNTDLAAWALKDKLERWKMFRAELSTIEDKERRERREISEHLDKIQTGALTLAGILKTNINFNLEKGDTIDKVIETIDKYIAQNPDRVKEFLEKKDE